MTDSLDLAGRVAYVTGATRGIGAAIASTLAAHGADIALGGRDASQVTAAAERLASQHGVRTLALPADLTDPDAGSQAFRKIKSELGGLSIMVNNAGIMEGGLIGMLGAEGIDRSLAINTRAVILNIQGAARLMRKNGGSIVNLTSILGVEGNTGQTVYAASKAAVIGATKSAAKELASQQIRVNAVAPGFIETDLTASLDDAERERTLQSIGMGRAGSPDDIANVVLFLASDLSSYVTGQVIGVDGEMLV